MASLTSKSSKDFISSKATLSVEQDARGQQPSAGMQSMSKLKKYTLLLSFCAAQFLDVMNVSAILSAIAPISQTIGLPLTQSVWLVSSYQLTFASFLLVSGNLSNIYNPKYLFTGGFAGLGLLSLIAGFVKNKIALLVIRALSGIAAAITIPSALTAIVRLFPDPSEQAHAVAIFCGTAALGSPFGLVFGAIFVQFASWTWIFWLNTCIAAPFVVACFFLIPAAHSSSDDTSNSETNTLKAKRLDFVGISILTTAIILFIFALTSGSADGWASAAVLAPLIISIFMIAGFLFYETKIPEDSAALPPRLWFYPNFAVLFAVSLLPFCWWTASYLLFIPLWQDVYHWSPTTVAARFLVFGVLTFIIMNFIPYLQKHFKSKTILLTGGLLLIPATILLPFADRPSRFWSFVFPSTIIGTVANTLLYSTAGIEMFQTTPPAIAGTVGAVFNAGLQLGSAVGLAIITSIAANVEAMGNDPTQFKGRAAGFWFLLGLVCLEICVMVIFIKEQPKKVESQEVKELEQE